MQNQETLEKVSQKDTWNSILILHFQNKIDLKPF